MIHIGCVDITVTMTEEESEKAIVCYQCFTFGSEATINLGNKTIKAQQQNIQYGKYII